MKNVLGLMGAIVMTVWFQQAVALTAAEEKLVERIKPVAKVCVQGEDCAAAQATVAAAAPAGPRSGEDIYNGKCMACHATGAAGAPKVGDVAAWAPRISQGLETLVSHAIKGLNAMPPRGTCGACSDEEIGATVEYTVGKSQ